MPSMSTLSLQRPETKATRDGDTLAPDTAPTEDLILLRIEDLRSGDPKRVVDALGRGPIGPELAPHVVPLLAWDAIYPHAAQALAQARPQIEGLLVDRLLDPN